MKWSVVPSLSCSSKSRSYSLITHVVSGLAESLKVIYQKVFLRESFDFSGTFFWYVRLYFIDYHKEAVNMMNGNEDFDYVFKSKGIGRKESK